MRFLLFLFWNFWKCFKIEDVKNSNVIAHNFWPHGELVILFMILFNLIHFASGQLSSLAFFSAGDEDAADD